MTLVGLHNTSGREKEGSRGWRSLLSANYEIVTLYVVLLPVSTCTLSSRTSIKCINNNCKFKYVVCSSFWSQTNQLDFLYLLNRWQHNVVYDYVSLHQIYLVLILFIVDTTFLSITYPVIFFKDAGVMNQTHDF
jgi:hypothetical protein